MRLKNYVASTVRVHLHTDDHSRTRSTRTFSPKHGNPGSLTLCVISFTHTSGRVPFYRCVHAICHASGSFYHDMPSSAFCRPSIRAFALMKVRIKAAADGYSASEMVSGSQSERADSSSAAPLHAKPVNGSTTDHL